MGDLSHCAVRVSVERHHVEADFVVVDVRQVAVLILRPCRRNDSDSVHKKKEKSVIFMVNRFHPAMLPLAHRSRFHESSQAMPTYCSYFD